MCGLAAIFSLHLDNIRSIFKISVIFSAISAVSKREYIPYAFKPDGK